MLSVGKTRRNAGSSVLVLTNKRDIAADWVIRELQTRQASIVRLNTEDLPSWTATWRPGKHFALRRSRRTIEPAAITSVWYRRPGRPFGERVRQDSPPAVLNAQWSAFIEGALFELGGLRWLNNPRANSRAESKMLQLNLAKACGFQVPETIITNSARDAKIVSSQWSSGAVIKALDAPLIFTDRKERFVFTTRLRGSHLRSSSAVAMAPIMVQERIAPRVDVRVTVVGEKVFAAKAVGVTRQDWRLEPGVVTFVPYALSRGLRDKCLKLVRRLELRFAGIDLAIGGHIPYFLELNPNGEWGWLQAQGFPIAEAIADDLIGRSA